MEYQNPILYADYSDPDVIRVGEDYYMVASSFTYAPGVPLLHSRDLVHWELINYCLPRLPFSKYDRPSHGSGVWAPAIRFHSGMFYVFIPLPDEGIYVARSADPKGEFQLNCLCRATGWIDPCPFWDEDGRAYMVFAYAKSRCGIQHRLDMVEIDPDCTQVLTQPVTVFDGAGFAPTTEGPKLYKRDGYYYILMPSGGVSTGWQSALRSRSIYGPYEYRVVMAQGNTPVNGPHQGGWVTGVDGRHWFLHFQDVDQLGRILHLQPMEFQDGWPVVGRDENGDGVGQPVARWPLPAEGQPRYALPTHDDFSGDALDLIWQWQANPQPDFFRMEGSLRLFCRSDPDREPLLWYAPNALTRVPHFPAFDVTVHVRLEGDQPGDLAALGMLGHRYAYLGLQKAEYGNRLALYRGQVTGTMFEGQAEEELFETVPFAGDTVWLKLTVSADGTYRFFYRSDGQEAQPIGPALPLTRATWTGAKPCLWCVNRENRASAGAGVYAHFSLTPGSHL